MQKRPAIALPVVLKPLHACTKPKAKTRKQLKELWPSDSEHQRPQAAIWTIIWTIIWTMTMTRVWKEILDFATVQPLGLSWLLWIFMCAKSAIRSASIGLMRSRRSKRAAGEPWGSQLKWSLLSFYQLSLSLAENTLLCALITLFHRWRLTIVKHLQAPLVEPMCIQHCKSLLCR